MPTVSELLEREFPDEYARMSKWRFLLGEAEAEESLFAQLRPDGRRQAGERAVMAVGLTAWPQRIHPRPVTAVAVQSSAPAILVLSATGERDATADVPPDAFAELEVLQDPLGAILGLRPGETVAVVGVPRPVEQIAPGERAFCGGGPASFGSPISQARVRGRS